MAKICSVCLMVIWVGLKVMVIDSQESSLGFYLNGVAYTNGSTVLRTDIGVDDRALQCVTNSTTCCSNEPPEMRAGEFYFPNNRGMVPIRMESYQGYYRDRISQRIRLNRWENGTLTGQFRCEIPDANGVNTSLFINVADVDVSIASYGSNLTGGIYHLECSAVVNGSGDQLAFTWLTPDNNEVSLDSLAFNTTFSNNSSTLTINPLSSLHTGTYTCVVILGGLELRENFTVEVETGVTLSLRGVAVPNNSYVDINDIGEGEPGISDAVGLLCHTNKLDCCAVSHVNDGEALGQWFFPNQTIVNNRRNYTESGSMDFFYRNRFQSVVRLLRVGHPIVRGLFRCEIPNANDVFESLYVNIVDIAPTSTSSILPSTTFGLVPSPTPATIITVSIASTGGHSAGVVLTLTCSVVISGSSDQPNITWLDSSSQDLEDQEDDSRTVVSPTMILNSGSYVKSLSFSPLVDTDAGIYTCRVTLGGITKTDNSTVTVNDTIVQISSNSSPVLGQNYSLRCDTLTPVNFSHTFQWRKDDSLIPEVGPELSFSQLQLTDAGQYTCELVMGMVTIVSNRFNINMQVPTPEVAVTPQSRIPYNGTVYNLTGSMQLDTSNVDIDIVVTWEWSLRGQTLRSTETISAPHVSVLSFEPLATNSSGDYSLSVTVRPLNGSDFIIESSVVAIHSLNVLPLPERPPSISIISRQSSLSDECGEAMTLNCIANPVEGLFIGPDIIWIGPGGAEVPIGGNSNPKVDNQMRNLIFSDVTTENRGVYTCRVVVNIPKALIDNHFDESSMSVNTTFPGQVQDLRCINRRSLNELQVSWTLPTIQSDDVIDYKVELKQLQLGGDTREVMSSITGNETIIVNELSPEIPYVVAVKSRNSAGCGEEFQIYCFTQEGEPPPPANVTVIRVNSTAISVSWARRSLAELKGLAHYVVTYHIIVSSQARVLGGTTLVPWTCNSTVITDTQPGVQYRISVQTVNSAGMSALIEVQTQDDSSTGSSSNTVVAVVGGVVAVIVILAVVVVVIASINFALKCHQHRAFNLSRRSINSPFMMMNEFYESVDGKKSKTEELTMDTGYETVDKYNKGYVYSAQPYEEIRHRSPHPPLPSLQTVQMQPSERYGVAQCPLYASASNFDGDKETEETSFSQDKECSDDVHVQQGDTNADDERYVVNEFHDNETEAAYATVKVDYLASVTIR